MPASSANANWRIEIPLAKRRDVNRKARGAAILRLVESTEPMLWPGN
jgi:hypothetical protein